MSVRVLYCVHATSLDNEMRIASGWRDCELSELGRRQAAALGERHRNGRFDAVFSSDLQRAAESASIAWGGSHTIVQDPRLRECNYGDYNGRPSAVVEPMLERSVTVPMPNGESCEMVTLRIADFLRDLRRDFDGGSVVVVGHRAPQLALDVLLKGRTWEQAFAEDWRKTGDWRPGWDYVLEQVDARAL